MNEQIRDNIFFLACLSLIFNLIPYVLQLNFLGSGFSSKLSWYFLLIGFLYMAYTSRNHLSIRRSTIKDSVIFKFMFLYIGVTFVSLIVGLIIYPFYSDILNGPIDQIEKLPKVLELLSTNGISVDEKVLLSLWMIVRIIKNFFLSTFYTFGVSIMLWWWYRGEAEKGLSVLEKASIVATVMVLLYGIVDMFNLAGSNIARSVLVFFNPIFHVIQDKGTWWPPLLWGQKQLRSLFAEPSYFGMYSAFVMPFLWHRYIISDTRKWKYVFAAIIIILSLFTFMTNARTAVALLGVNLIVFFFITIWKHPLIRFKTFLTIVCFIAIAFIGNLVFNIVTTHMSQVNTSKAESTLSSEALLDANAAYFQNNVSSIASTNKRSNNSRVSILIANLSIGKDYPLLGVGKSLRNAYIPQYLPEMSQGNHEIEMWKKNQQEMGILRSGFPGLGEYTSRFAETGIVGLLIFLLPPGYLVYRLIQSINDKELSKGNILQRVFFLISFIAILTTGIGDMLDVFYTYWIMLGLGYAMIKF